MEKKPLTYAYVNKVMFKGLIDRGLVEDRSSYDDPLYDDEDGRFIEISKGMGKGLSLFITLK